MSASPKSPRVPLGIVLLDHGSRRPEADLQLRELASRVGASRPDAVVRVAHLEVREPTLEQAVAECVAAGAARVVVHPYFLAPGRHLLEDLPRLVREAGEAHEGVEVVMSEPPGLHDKLVEIVLERIAERE